MWLAACMLLVAPQVSAIVCASGYTCFQETTSRVWVMKNDGNVNGPNCAAVCSTALCPSGTYHSCDAKRSVVTGTNFNAIATGLGFTCKAGGCWSSSSMAQMMWVAISTTSPRACYFPANSSGTYDCNLDPGNANCFGERYSLVCPCAPSTLDQSCPWQSPPENTAMATWPSSSTGTTCLERINYWRQRACAEGWPECPPCGLPPMVECVACHECANSQADYDSVHGAHAAFTRCGDLSQGEGGGANCASVIDGFVAERAVFADSNGQVVCRGHCAPIVAAGCQTFFWGRTTAGYHTLDWGTCNPTACNAYCNDPTQTATGGVCRTDQWSYTPTAPTAQAPTGAAVTPTRTPSRVPTQTPPTSTPTPLPTQTSPTQPPPTQTPPSTAPRVPSLAPSTAMPAPTLLPSTRVPTTRPVPTRPTKKPHTPPSTATTNAAEPQPPTTPEADENSTMVSGAQSVTSFALWPIIAFATTLLLL